VRDRVRDDGAVPRAAPDALIFDFDGVIVDSYAAVTDSINAALAEHGMPERPAAELRQYIGPPTFTAFTDLAGEGAGKGDVEALVATYRRHYAAVYLAETSLIDGIVGVLEAASACVPLALATSKSVTFTQPLLEALGLVRFFAHVAAAAPNDASDDKTAIVARALAALAARGATAAAMVGDRSFDVEAALAHGLFAIGVTWGIGSAAELEEAGADVLIDAPGELLALLGAEGSPLSEHGRAAAETVYLQARGGPAGASRPETSSPSRSKDP
jgi:phosphoglycolate phosphatase